MRNKFLIITIGIILLLGSFCLFLIRQQRQKTLPESKKISLNLGNIDKISIKEKEKPAVILEKKDNQWIITSQNNIPADERKVASLLEALKTINQLSIASENPKNFSRLGIDQEAPILKISSGNLQQEIIIGSLSYARNGNFIKFPDENKVWLIPAYLKTRVENIEWKANSTPAQNNPTAFP